MSDKDMMVKPTTDGWVNVRFDSGSIVSLPAYCHVKLHKTSGGRDLISIQEGSHVGTKASLKAGFLIDKKHLDAGVVTFFLRSNMFTWQDGPKTEFGTDGKVKGGLAIFTSPTNKVPTGVWDIAIPDHPHKDALPYTGYAPHATSWFRVVTPNSRDRYLHPGTRSSGCATVGIAGDKTSAKGGAALADFEKIYAYLINRRRSPGIVGQIKVMDF